MKRFVLEVLGKNIDEDEIEKEVIKEFEVKVEKELQKIKEGLIKDKLKRYFLVWLKN